MEIIVPVKQVPDLVEELEIDESGRALDRSLLRFILNEFDEHALEQALLLKERHGARVTVVALDIGAVDETLFTCLAKGADSAIKIKGNFEAGVESHQAARILGQFLATIPYDLILTGVQAADDRDGQLGPLLASSVGLPHLSVVSEVKLLPAGKTATVKQEYAGGIMAEFEVDLPALLGIQAAEQPPRYAPVSKVRQAMKTGRIEEFSAPDVEAGLGSTIRRLYKPEAAGQAEMLEGSAEEVVDKLIAILAERGFLK